MPHADVDVSPATPAEVDQLMAGARETYAAGLRSQRGFPVEDAAAKAAADVARLLPGGHATPGHLFLAARRGGDVVGGIWVAVHGPDRADTAWVYHVEVAPVARRQGVAARLLEAAGAGARQRGAAHLGLNVFGNNTGAVALYDSVGFTVTAQQMVLPLRRD